MGNRQRLCAGLTVLLLGACGSSAPKGATPAPVDTADAGADVEAEAAQIQAIAGALNEFSPAVHTCWARGAADDFRLEGQVVLAVEIGAHGTSTIEVLEDSAQDSVLTECLTALWGSYRWPEVFAVGDRIQLPPFDFVAPTAQYSVALPHVPAVALGDSGLSAQVLIDAQNSGNGQASMTVLTAAARSEVPLHTHSSAELLFVLSGEGKVLGAGAPQSVAPGMAIYIAPGVVHGFVAGDEKVELVQLYAPGGPEGCFRNASKSDGTEAFTGKVSRRAPKPLVRSAAKAKAYAVAGGKAEVRILIDEDISGDPSAYIGALTAQPGAKIPLHRHGDSSELLFVIEGSATMEVAGKQIRVQAGDAVQIPSRVEHGAGIEGMEAFKALQFYAPGGPEQRFKAGGPAAAERK